MVEYRQSPSLGPRYEVGSDGSVWSLNYRNTGKRKQLKSYDNGRGYFGLVVYRTGDEKPVRYHVHRLVAEAFLSRPEGEFQVNHKNGNRADNRVKSLEWSTCSDNHRHAYQHLNRPRINAKGESNGNSKLTQEQAGEIRGLAGTISMKKIGDRFGVSPGHVHRIVHHKAWGLKEEMKGSV